MLLFIIFHVVGDFYLQSDEVAKNKENLNTFMLIHSIIYSIPFVLLFIYFKINVSLMIIITLSHLLIDVCSVKLKNKYKEKECLIFCSDQFIHIFIIYLNLFSLSIHKSANAGISRIYGLFFTFQ
ncbi:DUF3307 domain-containing protein [[Clostridium] innocuum]|nr:DUF3307 domain-containing protein [[Clostridium] innocuum]MCR0467890.1 DUF3307 domain-containing protein [[Clostridium] innocuum]MCR0476061.1 DUF3307 domain-containing protein [[Clostridium] innocuum]